MTKSSFSALSARTVKKASIILGQNFRGGASVARAHLDILAEDLVRELEAGALRRAVRRVRRGRRGRRRVLGLRSEVNSELNFPSNFEGLVLGCIDADFCK